MWVKEPLITKVEVHLVQILPLALARITEHGLDHEVGIILVRLETAKTIRIFTEGRRLLIRVQTMNSRERRCLSMRIANLTKVSELREDANTAYRWERGTGLALSPK